MTSHNKDNNGGQSTSFATTEDDRLIDAKCFFVTPHRKTGCCGQLDLVKEHEDRWEELSEGGTKVSPERTSNWWDNFVHVCVVDSWM